MTENTDPPPGSNSIVVLQRGLPLLTAHFDHVSVQKATCSFFYFFNLQDFLSAHRTVRHRKAATYHLPAAPSTHQFLSVQTRLCISPVQHGCRDGLAADRGGNVIFLADTKQAAQASYLNPEIFSQVHLQTPNSPHWLLHSKQVKAFLEDPDLKKCFSLLGVESSMSLRGREFLNKNMARCFLPSSRVFFTSSIHS